MTMPGTVACRAIVHGRVQGVWFRASTAERALEAGVRGYARNLDDGTVEVVAVGSAVAVASLLSWLRHGPSLARVTDVVIEELDPGAIAADAQGFTTR
jgi:acylphosphatase